MKDTKPNAEETNWRAWLVLDFFLVAGLVVSLFLELTRLAPRQTGWLLIFFSVLGVVPVAVSAARAVYKRKITIDLLASVALIFSFLAGQWFSAAFINLMLSFARIFDNFTELRTKRIIQRLLKYRPSTVKIKRGDKVIQVPVDEIGVGDMVVVGMGERLAIDGTVVEGHAVIDQSTLTGESQPVTKKEGDSVFSSTLNQSGSILVRAEKVGEDTTLAKIVRLISQASREKAKIEKIGDRFSGWYISLSFVGAIVAFVLTRNLNLVLALLLVVCADDIAVAVPLAFTASIAKAAEAGIIVKGADIIEAMAKIKVFAADKTGTLTRGEPSLKELVSLSGSSEDLLRYLVMAEVNSTHPIGKAVMKFAAGQGIEPAAPDKFTEIPGYGVQMTKDQNDFLVGRLSFLTDQGVKFTSTQLMKMEAYRQEGFTLVHVSKDGKPLGFAALEDQVRPLAREIIQRTRDLGVEHWAMLTGDNEIVAKKVAKEVGVDEYQANMTPEQKIIFIRGLRRRFGNLSMIGDGVNDAAALALADVSFAMGAIGSDVAIEAADIALMRDDLIGVPNVMRLSQRTKRVVRENFAIWAATNLLGLVLVLSKVIGPDGAAAYNFLTDFLPIFNALKVLRFNFDKDKFFKSSN